MSRFHRLGTALALIECSLFLTVSCAQPGAPMPSNSHATAAPIVNAPAGSVQGRSEGTLNVFKGIPYAVPPVGAARWTAPARRAWFSRAP